MKVLPHVVFSIVLASAGWTTWAAEARKPTREEIEIRTDVAALKALPQEARANAIAALRLDLRAKDDPLAVVY